jgi:hypothetical protein
MVTKAFAMINKEKSSERDKIIYPQKIFKLHQEMKLEWNAEKSLVAEMGSDAASINRQGACPR